MTTIRPPGAESNVLECQTCEAMRVVTAAGLGCSAVEVDQAGGTGSRRRRDQRERRLDSASKGGLVGKGRRA